MRRGLGATSGAPRPRRSSTRARRGGGRPTVGAGGGPASTLLRRPAAPRRRPAPRSSTCRRARASSTASGTRSAGAGFSLREARRSTTSPARNVRRPSASGSKRLLFAEHDVGIERAGDLLAHDHRDRDRVGDPASRAGASRSRWRRAGAAAVAGHHARRGARLPTAASRSGEPLRRRRRAPRIRRPSTRRSIRRAPRAAPRASSSARHSSRNRCSTSTCVAAWSSARAASIETEPGCARTRRGGLAGRVRSSAGTTPFRSWSNRSRKPNQRRSVSRRRRSNSSRRAANRSESRRSISVSSSCRAVLAPRSRSLLALSGHWPLFVKPRPEISSDC